MLTLDNLAVGYATGHPVLTLDPLQVDRGEFVCLLGRNGRGKSTLLRTLAGLQSPLSGHVVLDGRQVTALSQLERARRIGVVLTEKPSLPGLSARDLVELGRIPFTAVHGLLTPADRSIAAESLKAVNAEHLADRLLETLSDGERQRVMIARALAQQPALLLLDEITAFLDLPSRIAIVNTLRTLAQDRAMMIVLSSHDLDIAIQTADHLWVLPGDGTLAAGTPEDIALSGALACAFDEDGVAFSLETGRFEASAPGGKPVAVSGDPLASEWAARALSRKGWAAVDKHGSSIGVEGHRAGQELSWTVTSDGISHYCTTIGQVLIKLEHEKVLRR